MTRDATRRRQLEAMFLEVVDLPPSERETVLAQRCANRPTLAAALRGLLREHDRGTASALIPPALERRESPADLPHVGPYQLLERIGEGGMGIVYLAEQSEPLRRQVAIKVMRDAVGSDSIAARFDAERHALARMDHPNIARIYDGGTTGDGRPFFAMEYVRGRRLTTFCDDLRLPTEARLRLFVRICGAVHHAHQRGIIHRDLKPSTCWWPSTTPTRSRR